MVAPAVLWAAAYPVFLAAAGAAYCAWAVAVRLIALGARAAAALAPRLVRKGLHVARAGRGAMRGTPDPFGLPRRPRP